MRWKLQVRNKYCQTVDLGTLIGWHNEHYVIVDWNCGARFLDRITHLEVAGYQPALEGEQCVTWEDPPPLNL